MLAHQTKSDNNEMKKKIKTVNIQKLYRKVKYTIDTSPNLNVFCNNNQPSRFLFLFVVLFVFRCKKKCSAI